MYKIDMNKYHKRSCRSYPNILYIYKHLNVSNTRYYFKAWQQIGLLQSVNSICLWGTIAIPGHFFNELQIYSLRGLNCICFTIWKPGMIQGYSVQSNLGQQHYFRYNESCSEIMCIMIDMCTIRYTFFKHKSATMIKCIHDPRGCRQPASL